MIVFLFQSGVYWFQILDWYSASHCLLIIVFFEVIGLAYVYGELYILCALAGEKEPPANQDITNICIGIFVQCKTNITKIFQIIH